MKEIKDYPFQILIKVRKPSRYLGEEPFFNLKDWEKAKLKICLGYPDLYEIGRSHLGIVILNYLINQHPEYLADFVFAVAPDFEKELKTLNFPILSLNYRKPLREFDIIGISYAYELSVTSILNILDLAKIPLKTYERTEKDPLILGGGPSCVNPEPIAEFFDAIVIGDGEEVIFEILEKIKLWKENKTNKEELLRILSQIEGVYVPLFKNKVKRRIVKDLNQRKYIWEFGIPLITLIHDRIPIEIFRGCTRGCRFCEAGFYYRPVREKNPKYLLTQIEKNFKNTGFTEVSLMSLSTGDYTSLKELLYFLKERFYTKVFSKKYIFSLPSLRVGSIDKEILEFITLGRKTGLTFAPEAGSERLRKVINKNINIEDLIKDIEIAYKLGWKKVKLYFMIGLPTEKEEDLKEIIKIYKDLKKRFWGMRIVISVSTFIPKPHTPFQWERQISIKETYKKIKILKKELGEALKYHKPEQSFLEGVIARGGRELSKLIENAYKEGARLDSWKEYFNFSLWREQADKLDIDLEKYLEERKIENPLPWDHIDLRISKEFLLREREKAYRAEITEDCRWSNCSNCGSCNKEIKNLIIKNLKIKKTESNQFTFYIPIKNKEIWYEIYYTRKGKSIFLSQLDIIRLFVLIFNKIGLPLIYTSGFHPHPKIILDNALPIGVASDYEFIAFAMFEEGHSKKIKNLKLYDGLKILDVFEKFEKPKISQKEKIVYKIIPISKESNYLFEKISDKTLKVLREDEGYKILVYKENFSILKFLKNQLGIKNPLEYFWIEKIKSTASS